MRCIRHIFIHFHSFFNLMNTHYYVHISPMQKNKQTEYVEVQLNFLVFSYYPQLEIAQFSESYLLHSKIVLVLFRTFEKKDFKKSCNVSEK